MSAESRSPKKTAMSARATSAENYSNEDSSTRWRLEHDQRREQHSFLSVLPGTERHTGRHFNIKLRAPEQLDDGVSNPRKSAIGSESAR